MLFYFLLPFAVAQDAPLAVANITDGYRTYVKDSQRLYNYLFTNYTRELSPIRTRSIRPANFSLSDRFNVEIQLYFVKVIDVVEQLEKFNTLSEIFMTWTDPRLTWNPADFGGIKEMRVNVDSVWQPENSLSDTSELYEIYANEVKPAIVRANGSVSILRKYYAESTCKMTNIGHFPFDREVCSLYFMVYSYNYWDVSMTLKIPQKNVFLIAGNGEWFVEKIDSAISFYDSTDYAYEFDSGAFNVYMRREPQFYIYVIVLPCFILSVLSIIGMFCSRNRKEDQLNKLSIGLTSLMSIAVLLQIVTDSIPKSKTFPLLGVYAIICVFIIALGCAVLVSIPPSIGEPFFKKYNEDRSLFWWALERISKPHTFWHIFFQAANLINLAVFFSYW